MQKTPVFTGIPSKVKRIAFASGASNYQICAICLIKLEGQKIHGQKIKKAKTDPIISSEILPLLADRHTLIFGHPDGFYDKLDVATDTGNIAKTVASHLGIDDDPFYQCVIADLSFRDDESLGGYMDRLRQATCRYSQKKQEKMLIEETLARIELMRKNYEEAKDVFAGAKEFNFSNGQPTSVVLLESYHRNIFLQAIAHKILGKEILIHRFQATDKTNDPVQLAAFNNRNRREITISLAKENPLVIKKLYDQLKRKEIKKGGIGATWEQVSTREITTKKDGKTDLSNEDILEVIEFAYRSQNPHEQKEKVPADSFC